FPARRAETTICRHVQITNLLQWMQVFLVAQSFDRKDLLAGSFHRQGVAGIEWRAINQYTAGAATGSIAASVRARQPQFDCDHLPQCGSGFIFRDEGLSIKNENGFLFRNRTADGGSV